MGKVNTIEQTWFGDAGGTRAALTLTMSEDCMTCFHRDLSGPSQCSAFPEGIPETIRLGKRDHREPYKGDHGIQYETA